MEDTTSVAISSNQDLSNGCSVHNSKNTKDESHRNVVYSSAAPSENVTCILLSNNTDGQVVHQLIQLPTESVLVVGGEQNDESVAYHIPNQNQPEEAPEELLPAEDVQPTENLQFAEQLPVSAENTDHNPIYYTQTFCRDCNKILPSPDQLRDHNLAKHRGLYMCGVCLRGFKSTYCLKNHAATHKSKQFMCCYCDKTFSRGGTLKEHIMKFHKKDGQCPNCGKSKDVDHVCYKCKDCKAAFKNVETFEGHSCQQTKLFDCPYCGESFTRHQGLLNHMLNQENKRKFSCVVCNHRFNTQAQLRRHERVHAPDQWFKCLICGKKYATASGFRSHNIKKHKGHQPHSMKPRERLNQRTLRRSRPHRKYRDDAAQTNPPSNNSISCQTHSPSTRSQHENNPQFSQTISRNPDFPESSELRNPDSPTSVLRTETVPTSISKQRQKCYSKPRTVRKRDNIMSPGSDRDGDFSGSPIRDRNFVETSVSTSGAMSPLGETSYQVPDLMNCADDVIITSDAGFD